MNGNARDTSLLILHLRLARKKARDTAILEILGLLQGLNPIGQIGGPLAEVSGTAWVSIPEENTSEAVRRFKRIGYTQAIDLVTPLPENTNDQSERTVRWKKHRWKLTRVYEESREVLNTYAPHSRSFLLECRDGIVRNIKGYRGGYGSLEHRALPVEDARLLVNLVYKSEAGTLLDPYAGAGGIIIEAVAKKFKTFSMDIDPSLRFGLGALSAHHVVGNAIDMPFESEVFDAIATEPPYHTSSNQIVASSIGEMFRVLKPLCKAALLVAPSQKSFILDACARIGFAIDFENVIDRKGTEVVCLCLTKL